jgi:hypothetical protein
LETVKTAMGWLELPHWLMLAGAVLVVVGLIGLAIRQRANVQDNPGSEPITEPRPQLPPLPDLLDSRPRKNRRSMLSDEEHQQGPPPPGAALPGRLSDPGHR